MTLAFARPSIADPMPASITLPAGYTLVEQEFYPLYTQLPPDAIIDWTVLTVVTLNRMNDTAIADILSSAPILAGLDLAGDHLVYMLRAEQGPTLDFVVPYEVNVLGEFTFTPPYAGQAVDGGYYNYLVLATYRGAAPAGASPMAVRPYLGARPMVAPLIFLEILGYGILAAIGVGLVIGLMDYAKGKLDFLGFLHGVNTLNPVNPGNFTPLLIIGSIGGIAIGAAVLISAIKGGEVTAPAQSGFSVNTPGGFGISTTPAAAPVSTRRGR